MFAKEEIRLGTSALPFLALASQFFSETWKNARPPARPGDLQGGRTACRTQRKSHFFPPTLIALLKTA